MLARMLYPIENQSSLSKMNRITFLIAVVLWQSTSAASAERIKRAPPDDAELARLASEQAVNDGDLQGRHHFNPSRFLAIAWNKGGWELRFCTGSQSFFDGKASAK
jgi:hypothetical protein